MLFIIAVDSGKEAILHAAGLDEAGAGYMHFPIDYRCGYDESFFRGLLSEQMVIHRHGGKSTLVWEKIFTRNEALDCRNYARAAFHYFNWDFDKIERRIAGKSDAIEAKAAHRRKQYVISGGIKI